MIGRAQAICLGAVVSLALAACGGSESSSSPLTATPAMSGEAREVYTFDSLAQLMATADLTVEGSVRAIEKGKVVGAGDIDGEPPKGESAVEASGGLQLYDITLHVADMVYARSDTGSPEPGDDLTLAEDLVLVAPFKVGEHGYYFLQDRPGGGLETLSSQSRFLNQDGTMIPSNPDVEWAAPLVGMSESDFTAELAKARRAVESGEVDAIDPLKQLSK